MRLKLFFVMFVVLFALLGEQVFAQNGRCQEFTFAPGGYCYVEYFVPWIAFGGGWTAKIKGVNISPDPVHIQGPIQFGWNLGTPTEGLYGNLVADFVDNLWKLPEKAQGTSHWLLSGQSIEVTLLSDAQNPTTTAVGSIVVCYSADEPEYLRGLPRPSVQFNHTSGLQATEPALDPAPVWYSPVTATADRHEDYSFAVGNPGKEEITVQGTATNQNGKVLGTQIWTVPAGGTMGLFLSNKRDDPVPGFGSDLFPEGKDFTGWLELAVISPTSGMMVPLAIQYSGNGVSSTDIQPFQKK